MAEEAPSTIAAAIDEPALTYYTPAEVSVHFFSKDGMTWAATYFAKHDGTGFKVYNATREPLDAALISQHLNEVGARKDLDIPGMELLAATLNTRGTDDQLARLKAQRISVAQAEKFFAVAATAVIIGGR